MTVETDQITQAAHTAGRAVHRHATTNGHPHGCGRTCINNALSGPQRIILGVDRVIAAAIELGLVDYTTGGRFVPGPVEPHPPTRGVTRSSVFADAMTRRNLQPPASTRGQLP